MKERIIFFLGKKKITSAQFAEKIGIQRSRLSHIISGRNKPNLEFIQKMLESYPELNADWLLLGKGQIYDRGVDPQVKAEPGLFDIPKVNKTDSERKIDKILVFYTDKTFDELVLKS